MGFEFFFFFFCGDGFSRSTASSMVRYIPTYITLLRNFQKKENLGTRFCIFIVYGKAMTFICSLITFLAAGKTVEGSFFQGLFRNQAEAGRSPPALVVCAGVLFSVFENFGTFVDRRWLAARSKNGCGKRSRWWCPSTWYDRRRHRLGKQCICIENTTDGGGCGLEMFKTFQNHRFLTYSSFYTI